MPFHSPFHKKGLFLLKNQFRNDLIAHKHIFIVSLANIPENVWHNRANNSQWTFEEIMSHITSNLEMIPQVVTDIRKKRGFIYIPSFVTSLIRFLLTRNTVHITSKEEVKKRYENAHDHALRMLQSIDDIEWEKGQTFFGTFITIRDIFDSFNSNFQKYIEHIKVYKNISANSVARLSGKVQAIQL